MAIHHPKFSQRCVYCNYWIGNAGMELVTPAAGYKYDAGAQGKCTKKSGAIMPATCSCQKYEPSMEAKRLL